MRGCFDVTSNTISPRLIQLFDECLELVLVTPIGQLHGLQQRIQQLLAQQALHALLVLLALFVEVARHEQQHGTQLVSHFTARGLVFELFDQRLQALVRVKHILHLDCIDHHREQGVEGTELHVHGLRAGDVLEQLFDTLTLHANQSLGRVVQQTTALHHIEGIGQFTRADHTALALFGFEGLFWIQQIIPNLVGH